MSVDRTTWEFYSDDQTSFRLFVVLKAIDVCVNKSAVEWGPGKEIFVLEYSVDGWMGIYYFFFLTCSPTICQAKAALPTQCHQHRIFLLYNEIAKIYDTYFLREIVIATRFILFLLSQLLSIMVVNFLYLFKYLLVQTAFQVSCWELRMWKWEEQERNCYLNSNLTNMLTTVLEAYR